MIQNLVGPPIAGVTDLKSSLGKNQEKDFKGSGSDSFGKALEQKMSSQSNAQRDSKGLKNERPEVSRRESPRPERQEERSSKLQPRAEQTVTKQNGITSKKEAPSRQQAIKEFMDSFESEFEIPSTRLVDAMASLTDEELTLSPEETAEAVVDQLGLSDADAERAQAMYVGLLAQLKQVEAQPALPEAKALPASMGMGAQDARLRFEAAQNRQNAVGASVDRLNQKFWMKNPGAQSPVPTSGFDRMTGDIAQRMMLDEASFAEAPAVETPLPFQAMAPERSELPELPPHLQGQMTESISPQLLAALAAKQAAAVQQSQGEASEMSAETLPEDFDMEMAPQLKQDMNLSQADTEMTAVAGEGAQEQLTQQESQMGQSQNFAEKSLSPEKKEAQGKMTAKAAEFKQTMTGLEGMHSMSPKMEALRFEQAMPAAATTTQGPTQADTEATVKSLMNQAQYLVKKGGGEVKVEMTPEGMGKIHLRVQLQDGKVNLQMSADTPEAKKTIESGLAELKTSLAAHKLSVDHVKVDVVSGPSTDVATQNQSHMNGQQQRDQTRQFWNQFNDNFGSQQRRDAYLQEGSGLRGYGQRRADPLQPIETAQRKGKATLEGRGSGLNLVA